MSLLHEQAVQVGQVDGAGAADVLGGVLVFAAATRDRQRRCFVRLTSALSRLPGACPRSSALSRPPRTLLSLRRSRQQSSRSHTRRTTSARRALEGGHERVEAAAPSGPAHQRRNFLDSLRRRTAPAAHAYRATPRPARAVRPAARSEFAARTPARRRCEGAAWPVANARSDGRLYERGSDGPRGSLAFTSPRARAARH